MHEYSIVQALLNQCEEQAAKHNTDKIVKVVTKIGVLSGIEPDLMRTAFDTFKEGTVCEEADFIMNIQKVVIKCSECHKEAVLEKHEYLCPYCKSGSVTVVDGNDMYLMSLEME